MKRTLLFALFAAGCGGPSAPTVPAAPAPTPVAIEVRDGWTGEKIAPGTAPGVGSLVSPLAPTAGSSVTVSAPGHLTRVQILSGPVYLWPQDEAFVRQLVYENPYGGLLTRWSRGFSISAPGYEDLAAQVAAEVTRTTGLPVTVVATGGDVTASVDEANPYWPQNPAAVAGAQITRQGNTVVSAKIIFKSRVSVRLDAFTHEMGHTLGLSHVEGSYLMNPTANGLSAFSEPETIALRMMYARRAAGNAPPDREGVASASTERHTVVLD